MPRKPKDLARDFFDAVRRAAAERRGEPLVLTKKRGRPSNRDSVRFHDLAERVAKYRDAGFVVRSKFSKKDAISKVVDDLEKERSIALDAEKRGLQRVVVDNQAGAEHRDPTADPYPEDVRPDESVPVLIQPPGPPVSREQVREAWEALGYLFPKKRIDRRRE